MKLLLRVIDGPAAGTERLLSPAAPFVIGRGQEADLGIPGDRFLSRRHLAIFHQRGGWWVKDLDSRNGSTLNQQPLGAPMALADGHIVGAGNTRIQVFAGETSETVGGAADAPTSRDRAAETLNELAIDLYALIDLTRYPRLVAPPAAGAGTARWAVVGEDSAALQLRLVKLDGDLALLRTLTAHDPEHGGAVLFSSDAPTEALVAHLADILWVQTDDGRRWLFRYYFPAILRAFLSDCSAATAARFFGPVTRFLLTADDARSLTSFSRTPRGVLPRQVPLDRLCFG